MSVLDWLIVCIPLLIVAVIALRAQRYVKGVSDFLTAGRVAGRYVVAVAGAEAGLGLISIVANTEWYYRSGFAVNFWYSLGLPISALITLSGFAIYRFRETRAMTLAQFLEIRYSKRLRIFAGIIQAVSGIVNYGLFPAVGARFLMYYCDLPVSFEFLSVTWPTFGVVMAIFLSVAVFIVSLGGQITVMVTDCVQGILSYPMYLIVVVAIIVAFSWSDHMAPALMDRAPGRSMLNPFDTFDLRDFNIFYIVVALVLGPYNALSWSGTQGYNAAAITPHEQKMGRILGTWRAGFSGMMFILIAIIAYTYMHHADFSDRAVQTERNLNMKILSDIVQDPELKGVRKDIEEYLQDDRITPNIQARLDEVRAEAAESARIAGKDEEEIEKILNPQEVTPLLIVKTALKSEDKAKAQTFGVIHSQMVAPRAWKDIFPVGVTGVFCALMVFLLISTDTTYLHSWGSIIVQDIILPFRKKPFTPRQQLLFLRIAIACVAIYAFFFSFYFGQITFILMFMALTGSLWMGGAGALILGGLYWKRGTAAGAWTALIIGSSMAVFSFVGMNYWASWIYPMLERSPAVLAFVTKVFEGLSSPFEPIILWRVTPDKFPINGQEIYFLTTILSILSYIVASLLTCRVPFNMERMLHRGKYRREDDRAAGEPISKPPRSFKAFLQVTLGIDAQFTKGDKILSWSVFIYLFCWAFGSFMVIMLWNVLFGHWPEKWWANWFFFNNFILAVVIGIVSTVWFTIGSTLDLRRMFKRLATRERNKLDDGRVIGHVNVDDIDFIEHVDHTHIEGAHEDDPEKHQDNE